MCNAECAWSSSGKTCITRPLIHHGKLPDFVSIKVVVGFDHTFKKKMGGDRAAREAVKQIIRDANRKLGQENLKPGVKLEIVEIYPVNVEVPLQKNAIRGMPKSHKGESSKKGFPFLLLLGKGGGSGAASVGTVCTPQSVYGAWAIAGCVPNQYTKLVILHFTTYDKNHYYPHVRASVLAH